MTNKTIIKYQLDAADVREACSEYVHRKAEEDQKTALPGKFVVSCAYGYIPDLMANYEPPKGHDEVDVPEPEPVPPPVAVEVSI